MATTFVFPTFVADGSLSETRLPTYVVDGSLVVANIHLPPYVFGTFNAENFLPTFLMTPSFLNYTPVGGVLVGGRANIVGDPWIPNGGVNIGGSAPSALWSAYIATGGVNISGAAVVNAVIIEIYDIGLLDSEPQGGVSVSGSAVIADLITYVPSGGVQINGSAVVQEAIPYNPTGGAQIGGVSPLAFVVDITPVGGTQVGGSAPSTVVYSFVGIGGVSVSGVATVADRQAWYAPQGGVSVSGSALAYMKPASTVLTTENPYADAFPGWSVNYETDAPSRYMDMPVNSIAAFQGRPFIANAGGIYEVGADDDAGQPIVASVTFAKTDFQDSHEKRMEYAYIGVRSTGKMRLKVHANKSAPQYYILMPNKLDATKGTRVKLGKGIVGRYWDYRLDNIDGADFELDSAEFNPVKGQRHGA